MAQKPSQPEFDREEFHRAFLKNQRRVFAYILTMLPSLNDAEEVFQEACVVLLNKAEQYQPGTDFTRWACQIAHFETLNYRRRSQKQKLRFSGELLDAIADKRLSPEAGFDDRREALQLCMQTLRPDDRNLLEERYRRKITTSKLADELDRPTNTLYKALQRIRGSLLECIERKISEEADK